MKTRQPATGNRQTGQKPRTKAARRRGKLKPMQVSMGFREFVLDQLGGIPDLQAKAMFGGVGLYAGEVFFGILAADVVYFKVDDKTKREYEAARSEPFAPYADPEGMTSSRVLLGACGCSGERARCAAVGEDRDCRCQGGEEGEGSQGVICFRRNGYSICVVQRRGTSLPPWSP